MTRSLKGSEKNLPAVSFQQADPTQKGAWQENVKSYDVIINLHWARPLQELTEFRTLLHRHSLKAICASQRTHDTYEGVVFSYRLLLRDPERMDDLLTELRSLQGVSRVTGLKADEQSEI